VRDLTVRGVYRRHVVEPAIALFGTNDPAIVGDPMNMRIRRDLLASGSGWVRPVLEPLARADHGPASWYQNVCEDVVGSIYFTRTWAHVDVRIQLVPDADVPPTTMATLETTWKTDIEGVWNNPAHVAGGPRLPWRCAGTSEVACRVSVQVHWVTTAPHHVVVVHSGSGRSDQGHWYVMDGPGVAAHEFGHMLGLPDEYMDDDLCPGRSPVGTGTVMDNNSATVVKGHLQFVTDATGTTLL
jgi:hypothetical protein